MIRFWSLSLLIISYVSGGINLAYSEIGKFYPETVQKDFVVDAPWRVESVDMEFPLFVYIKDSDKNSFVLQNIKVYDRNTNSLLLQYDPESDIRISSPAWTYYFTGNDLIKNKHQRLLTPRDFGITSGGIFLDLEIKIAIELSFDIVQRLQIYVAESPLPRFENWYSGDVHYHSEFTLNPKDFGSPLEATDQARKAIGLDWVTATDHSPDYGEESISKSYDGKRALEKWESTKAKFKNYDRMSSKTSSNTRKNVYKLQLFSTMHEAES